MTLLAVSPHEVLRQRGSAEWRMYPPDVTPFTVAEMDFDLAEPVADALRAAVERSDLGYADGFEDLADAYAGFARSTWGWQPNPRWMTAATDVGVGVVELASPGSQAGPAQLAGLPAVLRLGGRVERRAGRRPAARASLGS